MSSSGMLRILHSQLLENLKSCNHIQIFAFRIKFNAVTTFRSDELSPLHHALLLLLGQVARLYQ
jgi:hypothetical protein